MNIPFPYTVFRNHKGQVVVDAAPVVIVFDKTETGLKVNKHSSNINSSWIYFNALVFEAARWNRRNKPEVAQ